ncbi:MAG TPA: SpoIID/LytB domain-containing protein [Candidatus Anoxymicrobiaceae bacterium]
MFQRFKELIALWGLPSDKMDRLKNALPFWGFPAIIGCACVVVLILIVVTSGGSGARVAYAPRRTQPVQTSPSTGVQAQNTQTSPATATTNTNTSLRVPLKGPSVKASNTLSSGSEVPSAGSTFVFKGYGRAHGVGLCMDGVLYRAKDGQSYMDIINYYYTSVTVAHIDDSRTLRVRDNGGGIHTLSMKDYLCHLVEEPDDYPVEGLKVLYVAARTYALNVIARGKHTAQGFDICSSGECCQAFDPNKDISHYPNSIAAVNATSGQVLTYGGAPIDAAYCGSCGGHTDNNEDVWGGQALPYLRGKPDSYCSRSPRYCTTKEISVAELSSRLGVGQLKLVDLSDRTPGGRVRNVRITGANGSKTIKGKDLEDILGFRTTRYEYSFK